MLRTALTRESVAIVRANTTNRYVHEIRKSKIRRQPNSRKRKNVQQPRQEFARVPFYFKPREQEQRTVRDQFQYVCYLTQEANALISRAKLKLEPVKKETLYLNTFGAVNVSAKVVKSTNSVSRVETD